MTSYSRKFLVMWPKNGCKKAQSRIPHKVHQCHDIIFPLSWFVSRLSRWSTRGEDREIPAGERGERARSLWGIRSKNFSLTCSLAGSKHVSLASTVAVVTRSFSQFRRISLFVVKHAQMRIERGKTAHYLTSWYLLWSSSFSAAKMAKMVMLASPTIIPVLMSLFLQVRLKIYIEVFRSSRS